ncbi:MAG: YicC/YloC family endoribonuclease, partial [Gammaproteobacteria bacterium]
RAAITKKIKRGKIECSLTYKKTVNEFRGIVLNEDYVAALLDATARIERHMQNPGSFSALEILNFPGVQQESEADSDQLKLRLIELMEDAVSRLTEAREREGEQLGLAIAERCRQMQGFVDQAKGRMPEVMQALRRRLREKVEELCSLPDYDRLDQEMVMLTQKLDVDEELDRLETHINEVRRLLNEDEPVGRRLDFLMQEMNREANTLGSKSADKDMTQISIELKVLIEQMREQIQNIE